MAVNANWPLTATQVAFNAGFGTTSGQTWSDLTSRQWSLTCSRGRQYEVDQNMAGEGQLVFADRDEALNPGNPSSPYSPNVLPYRQIMVQAQWPPAPVGSATNLLPGQLGTSVDPSFESYSAGSTPSWLLTIGSGVTPTVSTTNPQQGAKCVTYNVTAGGGTMGIGLTIRCIPGQQYTSSLYLRQAAANTSQIFINGGAAGTSTTTTGAYVRLTLTWTASQPTHQLWVASFATSLSGTVNVDAIQHEPGASASAFATSGPVVYGLHRGFVERWPSTWKYQGMYGYAQVETVDGYAALAARKLHTEYPTSLLAKAPNYLWRLGEPQGSTAFADNSGNSGPSLTRLDGFAGQAAENFAAGTQMNIPGDAGGTGLQDYANVQGTPFNTSPVQTGTNGNNPISLGSTSLPVNLTLSAWFSHTGSSANGSYAVFAGDVTGKQFAFVLGEEVISGTGSILAVFSQNNTGVSVSATVTDTWKDGKPHLYVADLQIDVSRNITVNLYVDGTLRASGSTAATAVALPLTATVASVAGYINDFWGQNQGPPGCVISNVGMLNRRFNVSEVTDLWNAGQGYKGETSGVRIVRYLGYAQYTQPMAIDTGQAVMGISNLAEATIALDACQAVTVSENGNFWNTGDGTLTFYARTRRYNATTPKWVFGENQSGGEYPYEGDIAFDYDPQLIYNDVQVENSGGITAPASDSASQNNYGPRTYQRQVNVSDAEAQDAANWLLSSHRNPFQRVNTLTIKPSANPALWPVALGAEVGDLVTVIRRTTAGWTFSQNYFIEQVAHNQRPDSWTVQFQMSPATFYGPVGLLDDTTYGRLGTGGASLNGGITNVATTASVDSTNGGDVFTTSGTPFSATIDSEIVTVTAVASVATDAFGRTVSNGWGTADTGQAWTTTGGAASDYSVGSGLGKQSNGTVNVLRTSTLSIGSADFDYTVDVNLSVNSATGASATTWVCGRYTDASNYYVARADLSTGGEMSLLLAKRVAGTLTTLVSNVTVGNNTSATTWRLRFQGIGSALGAKLWIPASYTEPLGWQVAATDTALTTGSLIGLLSRLETGNTNTLPVVWSFDNLAVTNPQAVTVTRPTDGTATSHATGASVQVYRPFVLAY